MDVTELYRLGRLLAKEIGGIRLIPNEEQALGKGASGDKTFPIDKRAEDIIINYLESLNFPMSVISEEIGSKDIRGGGQLKALIDPIDGSKNAINGIPFYCSSIALLNGERIGDVFMSLVVNLTTGDCFVAKKGEGAFFNDKRIFTQRDNNTNLLSFEAQNPQRDISKILKLMSCFRRVRCLGATALDMAYTAYGAISVFITPAPSRSFDFAGGWLLVKEAGGIVTDTEGKDIDDLEIGIKKSIPIVASANTNIHLQILKVLNEG
ncbi:MAG: inositol monophosphatase family protein [Thermodesulfovibrionales bacterium]